MQPPDRCGQQHCGAATRSDWAPPLLLQEARLGGPTPPKELGKLYASILELLCGQLDVLRPGGGVAPPPQAPELAAALRALDELHAALAARLQVTWAARVLGVLCVDER